MLKINAKIYKPTIKDKHILLLRQAEQGDKRAIAEIFRLYRCKVYSPEERKAFKKNMRIDKDDY